MFNVVLVNTDIKKKAIDEIYRHIIEDRIKYGKTFVKDKLNLAPMEWVFEKTILNIENHKKIDIKFAEDKEKIHIYRYNYDKKENINNNLIKELTDKRIEIHHALLSDVKKIYKKYKPQTHTTKKVCCKQCKSVFSVYDKFFDNYVEQDGTYLPSMIEYAKYAEPLKCTFCSSFDLFLDKKDLKIINSKLLHILEFNDTIEQKIDELREKQINKPRIILPTSGYIAIITI